MSWVSSFLQYLGLAPDEDYPEYDDYDEAVPDGPPSPVANRPIRTTGPAASVDPELSTSVGTVRPLTSGPVSSGPSVVPLPSPRSARAQLVAPSHFGQAKEVADHFKGDEPVALDLTGVDHDLARRLIDFSSGLCYALGGKMEKLDPHAALFLLIPVDIDVSTDDRQRIVDRVTT